jgi:hypothetical protein
LTRYIFDLESNGFLDKMDIVHCLVLGNVETGAVHRFTQTGDLSEGATITDGLEMLATADEVIGHNIIKFDIPALQKLYPWFHPQGRVTDTLVLSRLIWTDLKDLDSAMLRAGKVDTHLFGSHSLKAWGQRLGNAKGDFAGPWDAFTEEMLTYCVQDVGLTRTLYDRILSKNYSPAAIRLEHQVAEICWQIEKAGFTFDAEKAIALNAELMQRRSQIEEGLRDIFPPLRTVTLFTPKANNKKYGYVKGQTVEKVSYEEFNPGSRQQVAKRLMALGWEPTEWTNTGLPQIDDEVLREIKNIPQAALLAEYFMLQKRIGQLSEGKNAWTKLYNPATRALHGSINPMGTVTGRASHAHPNIAQVPASRAPYGTECRSLFTVREGEVLVGTDMAGLELRCLAHYMAKYDKGAYAKLVVDGDPHTENQRAAGLPTRDHAKTFIYAFLYGAGNEKLGSLVGKGAGAGKVLRTRFLKKTPALRMLTDSVKRKAKIAKTLTGLDGRTLHVRSAHSALNTLLQNAGALLCKRWMVELVDLLSDQGLTLGEDYRICAWVHDELQIATDPKHTKILERAAPEAAARAGAFFNMRVPITANASVGKTWAQTH